MEEIGRRGATSYSWPCESCLTVLNHASQVNFLFFSSFFISGLLGHHPRTQPETRWHTAGRASTRFRTVSSSIRKRVACFWSDRPSTMHVRLETSMLIRKAASTRLTMSTSYETNTPPLSTWLNPGAGELCSDSLGCQSSATFCRTQRLTSTGAWNSDESQFTLPYWFRSKLSTTIWQKVKKTIYAYAKNSSELSRSLDNPCDPLSPASWKLFHLSFQSVCFSMELSDETNVDTFPGALNGSITSGAFA